MANSDADNLEALLEARDNIISALKDVTANPKPNYEIDGQNVSWGDYLKQLQDALKAQNDLIQTMDDLYEEQSNWYL